MAKEPDNAPAPEIQRCKFTWSEYDASPAPHGIANLTTGMWEFYDGTTRPITDDELQNLLS